MEAVIFLVGMVIGAVGMLIFLAWLSGQDIPNKKRKGKGK